MCKPQAKSDISGKKLLLYVDAETIQSSRVQAFIMGIMTLCHDSGSAEGSCIHSFSLSLNQCVIVGGKSEPWINSHLVTRCTTESWISNYMRMLHFLVNQWVIFSSTDLVKWLENRKFRLKFKVKRHNPK